MECKKDGFRVRCLCDSIFFLEPMIQCEDEKCKIWQHRGCVTVPDPVLQASRIPSPFFCDVCRVNHSDPLWATIWHPLKPMKLAPLQLLSQRIITEKHVEQSFELSNHHMKLLERNDYELQAWVILLNDEVQCRIHWPLSSEFHVNGIPVQVFTRPSLRLLGIDGRDDGPLIKKLCKEGMNKITLSWCDTRTFCLGIRLAKRLTTEQSAMAMTKRKKRAPSFLSLPPHRSSLKWTRKGRLQSMSVTEAKMTPPDGEEGEWAAEGLPIGTSASSSMLYGICARFGGTERVITRRDRSWGVKEVVVGTEDFVERN